LGLGESAKLLNGDRICDNLNFFIFFLKKIQTKHHSGTIICCSANI
jgi:hypothetical protein